MFFHLSNMLRAPSLFSSQEAVIIDTQRVSIVVRKQYISFNIFRFLSCFFSMLCCNHAYQKWIALQLCFDLPTNSTEWDTMEVTALQPLGIADILNIWPCIIRTVTQSQRAQNTYYHSCRLQLMRCEWVQSDASLSLFFLKAYST